MKLNPIIATRIFGAILLLAGTPTPSTALDYSELVGNWAIEITDSVVGKVEGEIAFMPTNNPGYLGSSTSNWFRDAFGTDNIALQNGKYDGSNYYTKIYSPDLFPQGPYMRHMNVTFSADGLSGAGTVHYGDDVSGSVSMRKIAPEMTASLCCGVKYYGEKAVENGVLVDPAPGQKAIWIELKGTGLPQNMSPTRAYIDVQISDTSLNYWKAGRNDSGTWYLAFWIQSALAPGEKTIRLNGVDIPVYIPIRQPDGSVAGAAPETTGNDDVQACSDADKALDPEFSAAAARTRARIDAVGELASRGRYGSGFDVAIAGGEDHAQIAIVLRDIKATLAEFARAADDCDADAWDRLVGRLVNHQEQLDRRADSLDDLEYRMLASQAALWKPLGSITGDDDLARLLEEAETNAQVLMPKAGVDPRRADAVLEHVDDVLTKFPTDASAGNRMIAHSALREAIRRIGGLDSDQARKVRVWLKARDENEVLKRYLDAVRDVAAELQPMIRAAKVHRPTGVVKMAGAR